MARITGKTGLNGVRHKRNHDPETKEKIRLSQVENRLADHGFGKVELSATQVTALRAIYDKLRPSLSAVEQTTINPDDKLTEEQIMAKFQQLIDAFPDLLTKLLADRAKDAPGIKAA